MDGTRPGSHWQAAEPQPGPHAPPMLHADSFAILVVTEPGTILGSTKREPTLKWDYNSSGDKSIVRADKLFPSHVWALGGHMGVRIAPACRVVGRIR